MFVDLIMKIFLVLLFLTLFAENHVTLAREKVEGWIYPLDDYPLDVHQVHPGGRVLVIPEHGRSLEPPLGSAGRPFRATVTVLTDEEARLQDRVETTARDLLLEVQRERELKRSNGEKKC